MTGTRDPDELLTTMSPELQPGRFVFTTVQSVPDGVEPVVVVREPEGTTLVLEREQADRLGLSYAYVAAMITLRVHSSLDAVGLTAAVSRALTDRGISCNVVAGYFHDHLFVPDERADEALTALRELAPPAEAGARVVYAPVEEHGWLLGRIVDPFGHHREIGKPLEGWPPRH